MVLPPSTAVPMPAAKGSVKTAKNKLAVSVTSFSFNFADLGVSGTCTPSSGRQAHHDDRGSARLIRA